MEENKKQVIIVKNQKSVGLAVILAFFFGPLGMLYSTVKGAIVMFIITAIATFVTFGVGLFITVPIGVVWSYLSVKKQNEVHVEY